jgi:putative radical SAM enzyme (TIGR03279 family)
MTEVRRRPSTRRANEGGVIDAVRPGSLADEMGLRAGDRITAIDGRVLRDAVDFQFYAAEDVIELEVVRGGAPEIIEVEKFPDEDLGIEFQDAAFDGIRSCNNGCFFCFLKGNPKGLRKTLYVKDDDYRLSFFHGNFVTLTNLTEDDWARLEEQRLSPLNVSVHATEPELRRYLLGNKHAPDVVEQLRRLGSIGIQANTQVVLCPGVNDRAALDRTISDLTALHPVVQNVSIVPVGATMYAEERIERQAHGEEIEGVTAEHTREVMAQVAPYQRRFRKELGRTLVYLADEYYLLGGGEPPAASQYDGFPQYENGIGMARSLLDGWKKTRRAIERAPQTTYAVDRISLVCATLIGPTLERLGREFTDVTGIDVAVHALENTFFGSRVNVSGLLVAQDIERQLRGRDLGDLVVMPRYALDYTGGRFLDEGTPEDLQRALGAPVAFASTLGEVLQIVSEPLESPVSGATIGATTNGKAWVDYASLAEGGAPQAARQEQP